MVGKGYRASKKVTKEASLTSCISRKEKVSTKDKGMQASNNDGASHVFIYQ